MPRIIETIEDLAEGVAALCALDPRLRRAHEATGLPPLRRLDDGFEGLVWIVVSQQVSVASAAAIRARMRAVLQTLTPRAVLSAPDETFRRGGLSGPKIRTLRALAAAVGDGLDLAALASMDADTAHRALVAVKGIGPWTADIYLMFCLGHADAFAPGDLALQEAARRLLDLEARPDRATLLALSERWRPWRSVAARLLFAYYRTLKSGRDGVSTGRERADDVN